MWVKHICSLGSMGHLSGQYDYGYKMCKAQCQWLDKSDEMQFIEVWTSQVQAAIPFEVLSLFGK